MRVVVERHIARFKKGRADGVVAFCFVGRVPVGRRRAGRNVEGFARFDELCVVEGHPGGLFLVVDLARPAFDGHSATRDLDGITLLGSGRGEADEKYG